MTIILVDKIETGTDPFGNPIYEEQEIEIENVLVSPLTVALQIMGNLSLKGS